MQVVEEHVAEAKRRAEKGDSECAYGGGLGVGCKGSGHAHHVQSVGQEVQHGGGMSLWSLCTLFCTSPSQTLASQNPCIPKPLHPKPLHPKPLHPKTLPSQTLTETSRVQAPASGCRRSARPTHLMTTKRSFFHSSLLKSVPHLKLLYPPIPKPLHPKTLASQTLASQNPPIPNPCKGVSGVGPRAPAAEAHGYNS